MSEAADRLLAEWESVRHVPSQALEAARTAASVPLSDGAAAAVVALADALSDVMRHGRRVVYETVTRYVILTNVLDGSLAVRRAPGGHATSSVDNFQYRVLREKRALQDIDWVFEQLRKNAGYARLRTDDWDLASSWREECIATDQPFVAIRLAERGAQVAFDTRTMRTPLSRYSLAQVRAAFERSGHTVWSGSDLSVCSVRSPKVAHRLARHVILIVKRDGNTIDEKRHGEGPDSLNAEGGKGMMDFSDSERIFWDLVARWEDLKLVPEHAIEAIRAAATVSLSDLSAEAVAAMIDTIAAAEPAYSVDHGIAEMFGRCVLVGDFVCSERLPGPPKDSFFGNLNDYMFRLASEPWALKGGPLSSDGHDLEP